MAFEPAWWCRNAHLQTIWASMLRPAPHVRLMRARWELPDGDFLDVDELAAVEPAPRLIVLHGLESSSRAIAVLGLLREAHRRGWGGVAVNFRGCSGEPNRLRRSYHGGDTADLAWVIARMQERYPPSPLVCAGVSLGGNVLLKYLGEQGEALPKAIRAAAAISAPFDLAASVQALGQGFSRVYQHRLVASLKRKTFNKLTRYPDLVDRAALQAVRTLAAFDDLVTAPVHGFADATAYWAASSAASFLPRIRRPTLLVNAEDDPFLPADALPRQAVAENPFLTATFTPSGGHIGFLEGRWPGAPAAWAEAYAATFLAREIPGNSSDRILNLAVEPRRPRSASSYETVSKRRLSSSG
jgi:predicted alpha/beta-fold hydrolase